jgi:hypothetical protein
VGNGKIVVTGGNSDGAVAPRANKADGGNDGPGGAGPSVIITIQILSPGLNIQVSDGVGTDVGNGGNAGSGGPGESVTIVITLNQNAYGGNVGNDGAPGAQGSG